MSPERCSEEDLLKRRRPQKSNWNEHVAAIHKKNASDVKLDEEAHHVGRKQGEECATWHEQHHAVPKLTVHAEMLHG